jgi:hypothetical protein
MTTVRPLWIWLVVALVALPIGSYIVFRVSLSSIAGLSEGWHPAWFGDSSYAEIIVLVPDNSVDGFSPELIPVSSSREYLSSHPGCTFLIPMNRQDLVQVRLKNNLKLSWTTFEIKSVSDGQEEITLYFMDRTDDSHGSRYRATKDTVQLESYRYVSDRGGIGIVLMAILVTLAFIVFVVGCFVARAIYIRRKSRHSQIATQ